MWVLRAPNVAATHPFAPNMKEAAMAVVVVRSDVTIADGSGGLITLHRGDAWDDTHSLVKANPQHFAPFAPIERGGIESATAAPGEKRGLR